MEFDESKLREIHHQFKTTIFMKDGSLIPVISVKNTICNTHLKLAHEVCKCVTNPEDKRRMLGIIEKVFDMGKRMDKGLRYYRNELGISKYDGKKLEKKVAETMPDVEEGVEVDVIPS